MGRLQARLVGKISAGDWNALVDRVEAVPGGACTVAEYVHQEFRELTDLAHHPKRSPRTVRRRVRMFRDALLAERHRLIQQEIEFYAIA